MFAYEKSTSVQIHEMNLALTLSPSYDMYVFRVWLVHKLVILTEILNEFYSKFGRINFLCFWDQDKMVPKWVHEYVFFRQFCLGLVCRPRFFAKLFDSKQLIVITYIIHLINIKPSGMDGLVSLELLDLHENQIGELSEDLLRCYSLKTIDLSGNHLTFLPSNFGDLTNLVEVTLCANLISSIPHSVGQLKKLEILKSSKNRLIELTPAICSCSLLTDLILCENQLHVS